MATNQERPFDDLRTTLGEYGRILWHRWRLGFVALGLVSSVAFWYSQHLPRHYRASTIFERRDDVVLRNLIHSNSPYSFDNLKSSLVMDMTGSRAMADAAVTVGLLPPEALTPEGALSNDGLRALDEALGSLDLSASVHMIHTSPSLDTIRLDCEANDPEAARQFVAALRDRYISDTRVRITGILESTRQFFQAELERYQQHVAQTNRDLRDQFKDFPGVNPTDLGSAGNRLEALRQERARGLERKADLEAQVAAREQFLVSTLALADEADPAATVAAAARPAPPVLPESDDVITSAIQEVERELADAATIQRMTEQHPTVRALRSKLEGLYAARQAIRGQHARSPSPVTPRGSAGTPSPRLRHTAERLRVELELDALRRQLAIVRSGYEGADARVRQFTGLYDQLLERGEELREVRDRLDQDNSTIAMWRQHLGQLTRILAADSEQRGTQFVLIEEPKDAGRAVSPRVASVFAVCAGSGLAVAALLVALMELLDRSFRSAGQVSRSLGIPVLECIGVIPTPEIRRRRMISRLVWTPALALLLGLLLTAGTLAYASLEHPGLHRRAMDKLDVVLGGFGTPEPAWVEPNEP